MKLNLILGVVIITLLFVLKYYYDKTKEVIIHFLISGLDQYVYDAVSSKQNFTTKWYKDRL